MFVFRPLRPKVPPYSQEVTKEIRTELDKVRREVKAVYENTTRNWQHDVKFDTATQNQPGFASVTVTTTDEIYGYVDEGTRPHVITPKNSKRLRFQVGGSPKTTPGIMVSGPGSKGSGWRSSKKVMHPGTKPRGFTETIQKNFSLDFNERISSAIQRGLSRANGQ